MKKPNIIKHFNKIDSIIYNAREFKKIKKEYKSFSNFLTSIKQMRDKEVFKLLMNHFKHIGDYTAEYYLHYVGYWR